MIAPVGATLEQGAWTSQIFDLVARWFPRQFERAQKIDVDAAVRAIVRTYIETTIVNTPSMIARTFGFKREQVETAIAALTARHLISKQNNWILSNARK